MRFTLLFLIFALVGNSYCYAQSSSSADQLIKEKIEKFVHKAMEATNTVPGLGLAVVRNNEIYYSGGYGLRDVEKNLPVTAETGFYIASTTKPLVCLAAAQLEHQGIIDLDDPLSSYYPEWEFNKTIDFDSVNLVDLMCHTHPFNNNGLQYRIAFIEEPGPEEFTNILLDFSTSHEIGFQYSNTSINITSAVLEKVTGKNWREIVSENIFGPLNMQHTTSSMTRATQRNYAFPYIKLDNKFKRLNVKTDGQMGSAGGTVTTPNDMARWIIANMNSGKVDGKQCIPKEVIARVQKNYTQLEANYYKFERFGYGLGLYHSTYEGDLLIHHFGGFSGYMAHASFMPEHSIGVVAFSNAADFGGRLPHIVAAYVYDLMLGKEDIEAKYEQELEEWKASVVENQETAASRLKMKANMLENAKSNPDKWEFDPLSFTGKYYNPRIGLIEVTLGKQDQLLARYGPKTAELLPLHQGSFLADLQVTGFVTPPIQFDIKTDSYGQFTSFSYGGREYRKIPKGITTEYLIGLYSEIRKELKSIATSNLHINDSVKYFLYECYVQGAVTEPYVSAMGYKYLNEGNKKMAIALFLFNASIYPDSSNAHDSLAEAYFRSDNLEMAEQHYKKSLELDPENENAKKMLEDLKKKK